MTSYTVLIRQTWGGEGRRLATDIEAESPEEAAVKRVEALVPESRDLPRTVVVVEHVGLPHYPTGFFAAIVHEFLVRQSEAPLVATRL